jgi:hypothetical protein
VTPGSRMVEADADFSWSLVVVVVDGCSADLVDALGTTLGADDIAAAASNGVVMEVAVAASAAAIPVG